MSLAQSIQNFNASKKQQQEFNQMTPIQQQMANDKQYKSISYHKQKPSVDS